MHREKTQHVYDDSLYRVYELTSVPRMFSLEGDLGTTCSLTPAQYLAVSRER